MNAAGAPPATSGSGSSSSNSKVDRLRIKLWEALRKNDQNEVENLLKTEQAEPERVHVGHPSEGNYTQKIPFGADRRVLLYRGSCVASPKTRCNRDKDCPISGDECAMGKCSVDFPKTNCPNTKFCEARRLGECIFEPFRECALEKPRKICMRDEHCTLCSLSKVFLLREH